MVTVTPKAVDKIREAFRREKVTSGGLRLGVLGGGCSGLSYQFKFDPKPRPTDNVLQFRRCERLHRSEEPCVSGWHDARLEGFADPLRLRVRESARQEELRLRHVLLCLSSEMQYYEALGLEPKTRARFGGSAEAVLRAQPRVASRPVQPRHSRRAPAIPGHDCADQRRLSNFARSGGAGRVLPQPKGFELSKNAPPELLEEVFELNMALEELRGGDESVRAQLESAEERFKADAGGDRCGLGGAVCAL